MSHPDLASITIPDSGSLPDRIAGLLSISGIQVSPPPSAPVNKLGNGRFLPGPVARVRVVAVYLRAQQTIQPTVEGEGAMVAMALSEEPRSWRQMCD